MNKDDYIPPVEGVKDKLHRIIRTTLSVSTIMGVPSVVSGVLLENFNLLWKPPAEARAERWVTDVIDSLNSLTERIENIHSQSELRILKS